MKRIFWIYLLILCTACVPYKEVLYMRDLDDAGGSINFAEINTVTLMDGDLVEIFISSISQETNSFFYKPGSEGDTKSGVNVYQIGNDGEVDLPLIGKVALAGKTVDQAEDLLRERLLEYLQKPVVNVRMVNFQVTVLGEVKNAGVYQVPQASANLMQVLGMAGDITLYGQRSNVLIIRNNGDEKRYARLNLNASEALSSEWFHLQNNDIVYIPPSRGRTSADDNVYRLLPLVLSGLTFVAVIISLTR